MTKTLGRGLSSLIPRKKINTDMDRGDSEGDLSLRDKGILEININSIKPNPLQPRKSFSETALSELSESIKEYGIIQPLVVKKIKDNSYELVVGERRLRAAKKAGFEKVPVILRDYDEERKLEIAIIENLQREDLNPIEKAEAYRLLGYQFKLTQEQVAKKVGKTRSVITNTLRILELPDEIREGISRGSISERHGVLLAGLSNEVKQKEMFRKIVDNKWTTSQAKQQVKKMGGTKEARIKENYKDKEREAALRNILGTKIEIKRTSKGGRIIIAFSSEEELLDIVSKIK